MGWQLDQADAADDQHHEGYVIGVERITETDREGHERETGRWREVGADFDHGSDDPAQREPRRVNYVQVECTCGWRSERMFAPLGTNWSPCCVFLPTTFDFEKAADEVTYRMWRAHVDGLGPHSLATRGRDLLAAEPECVRREPIGVGG